MCFAQHTDYVGVRAIDGVIRVEQQTINHDVCRGGGGEGRLIESIGRGVLRQD